MTDDRIRALFREMRDQPVPADSLVRVRTAVGERTNRRARFGWWVLAAVMGVVAVIAVVWPSRHATPAVRREVVPVRHEAAVPAPAIARPAAGRPQGRQRPRLAAPRRESVTIRIDTPDPDVVIFLIGD